MAFKLYTNTKFRIYHNLGGRFIPQYKNSGSGSWESFKELNTTVNRARFADAQKYIQRKADRLFNGQAHIELVEAERPQQVEPTTTEEPSAVRKFADLSPEEQIASLTRLINNPHFPEEEREKLLQQRTELEAVTTASQAQDREILYADFVIPDGKPFVIKPYVKPERQIPGRRNALRIEMTTPIDRCNLLPVDAKAVWHRDNRPHSLHLLWDEFRFCRGTECKLCPIAEHQLRTFDTLTYTVEEAKQ